MIDIHSHLLPGIDDGSRSAEQSVATLALFAADGVTDVVLTPHLSATDIDQHGEDAIDERAEVFAHLGSSVPNPPKLHLGFEIMLDRPMPALATGDRRYSLAGSRYCLVEFPYGVEPAAATKALAQMARAGVIPIVAHPERYYQCDVPALQAWKKEGARIQLDANEFTKSGRRAGQAREYLQAGLVDVLAADNHGDRRTLMGGRRFLEQRGFEAQADLLTVTNPAAVLHDTEMKEVPSVPRRGSWVNRIRRVLDG
jgi:protein-tyrosine phosphatase